MSYSNVWDIAPYRPIQVKLTQDDMKELKRISDFSGHSETKIASILLTDAIRNFTPGKYKNV